MGFNIIAPYTVIWSVYLSITEILKSYLLILMSILTILYKCIKTVGDVSKFLEASFIQGGEESVDYG